MFRVVPFFISLVLFVECNITTSTTKPSPQPLWSWQFDSTSYGCGNFIAYAFGDSYKTAIAIEVKACALSLTTTQRKFHLATTDSNLNLYVNVYSKDPRNSGLDFCNDIAFADSIPPVITESWYGISGTVYITSSIVPPCSTICVSCPYSVTITIDSLVLQKDGSDGKVFSPKFEFKNVLVGWLAG